MTFIRVPTRCTITCMEPGCTNKINYGSTDKDVPLYCSVHRTSRGRHSAVRTFVKPIRITRPRPCMVVMRCPACKSRLEVAKSDWMSGAIWYCDCGKTMIFHKDVD